MFKTVAQGSPRRSVAHMSLKGGRMKAHTLPWSQNGCTVVGHWSSSKKWEHCVSIWATRLPSLYHHCASFGRPMAFIERSLWRPLCLHSATTATLEPPWQWFCLHSAFFARPVVPLQQFWSFKEGTRVVLQQLHRNRTFWVPATTGRPNHFYGRTKVARRSQPCVKGALGTTFSEILSKIHRLSCKKMHLKTSSVKWRPFCLGLNVLRFHLQQHVVPVQHYSYNNYLEFLKWWVGNGFNYYEISCHLVTGKLHAGIELTHWPLRELNIICGMQLSSQFL